MAANKRSELQREADLERIAGLYFERKSQIEIALQLNISQQQVSYDLKTLLTRWTEGALAKIDEAKNRELAEVNNLEREYWQAYRESQKEFRGTTAERSKGTGAGTKVKITKEKRIGDPRYLIGVSWCIEQRCKILGLTVIKTENTVEVKDPYADQIKKLRAERGLSS